jgi:NADH-quinone oxidoreductase subunit I
MFGSGVLKGLGVTLKEFVGTYVDDIKKIPSRYAGGKEELDQTNASAQSGLFTVQYPEERRKLSERFRYIPMLVYEPETGEDRCTACGICAKVCPPQCIWIVRAKDEKGKPITRPAEFHIDTTICMNCGLCAEFCPFDAIKMNNDYEIAAQQRMPYLVFDLKQLRVPTTYYARIKPTDWAAEEAERAAKEAEKAAKPAAGSSKPEAGAPQPVSKPAAEPPAAAPAGVAAAAAVAAKRTPEEVERLKAEAAARRAAKAEGGEGTAPVASTAAPIAEADPAAATAAAGTGAKRTPEEIERLKAEAAARRAAKAGGEAPAAEPAPTPAAEAAPAPVAEAAPAAAPAEQVAPEASQAASAPAGVGAKRTPEEIERLKAEAAARRAAKAGQG